MGRSCTALTDEKVMQAKPGEKHRRLFDGGGLYVEISPAGSRIWRMKFSGANGKETRLTFGPYPEVSIELARTRRLHVRQLLMQGLDPRQEFHQAHMPSQTRVGEHRLLPTSIDKIKVGRTSALVGSNAIEQIERLVFPAIQRLLPQDVSQDDISTVFATIQRERGVDVGNLLYDICIEIAWGCLDRGLSTDELLEAMTDSRTRQRRWQ